MKNQIALATILLMASTPVFSDNAADAADTSKEHSSLVKSMLIEKALSKCRTTQVKALLQQEIDKNNQCPSDLDGLISQAADSCQAETDASLTDLKMVYSFRTSNPDDANAQAQTALAANKTKWKAKTLTALQQVCQK